MEKQFYYGTKVSKKGRALVEQQYSEQENGKIKRSQKPNFEHASLSTYCCYH